MLKRDAEVDCYPYRDWEPPDQAPEIDGSGYARKPIHWPPPPQGIRTVDFESWEAPRSNHSWEGRLPGGRLPYSMVRSGYRTPATAASAASASSTRPSGQRC